MDETKILVIHSTEILGSRLPAVAQAMPLPVAVWKCVEDTSPNQNEHAEMIHRPFSGGTHASKEERSFGLAGPSIFFSLSFALYAVSTSTGMLARSPIRNSLICEAFPFAINARVPDSSSPSFSRMFMETRLHTKSGKMMSVSKDAIKETVNWAFTHIAQIDAAKQEILEMSWCVHPFKEDAFLAPDK